MSPEESYLKIYSNKSEYVAQGSTETFEEGKPSVATTARMRSLKSAFESGFLQDIMDSLKDGLINFDDLNESSKENIDALVDSITSEVGRALVALTIMQMTIKAISSEQNIRLHKGGTSKVSFSWVDGVSMRTLDKKFVTPFLRRHNLIKLNADGVMMTRTLAENYPYTKLYKAKLKGAKEQWLNIVDLLESGDIDAKLALQYTLTLLQNKASDFEESADKLLKEIDSYFKTSREYEDIFALISKHIDESDHAARLFEVSMHSLMQVIIDTDISPTYELKNLSQMRSANKKHGNIGDIEVLEDGEIVISWDAKYGKNYLRDELDEISEKLAYHDNVESIGFVTTETPVRGEEIETKIEEIKGLYGLEIKILPFKAWVDSYVKQVVDVGILSEKEIANLWLIAYAESLAQKRRDRAPIDEPCFEWVKSLTEQIKS